MSDKHIALIGLVGLIILFIVFLVIRHFLHKDDNDELIKELENKTKILNDINNYIEDYERKMEETVRYNEAFLYNTIDEIDRLINEKIDEGYLVKFIQTFENKILVIYEVDE